MDWTKVVYRVESADDAHRGQGTGFAFDHDADGALLVVTCWHVVREIHSDNLRIKGHPCEVASSDGDDDLDLAVLRVAGLVCKVPLSLAPQGVAGQPFDTYGYEPIGRPLSGTLGAAISRPHVSGQDVPAWDYYLDGESRALEKIKDGYSGAPVCDRATGGVIAVITHRQGTDKGFAIDIANLSRVYSQTVAFIPEKDAIPKSQCSDPAIQSLSDQLHAAYDEKNRLIGEGTDTVEVQARIIELKRRIRQGGHVHAGDFLLDGRYKLIQALKQGGFGTIFRAVDTRRRREVAVKVLHGQYAYDRSRRERFFRGARKMEELQHQGIVQVLESEQVDEGHYFFVMEYLPGGDLRDAVLKELPASERVLDLVLEVGAALTFAHARGLVHRDVKPANIVLDAEGHPKLTDFDLVRAGDTTGGTRTGALGSVGYAAPEAMYRPQDVDARADVYGLSMTAIFALRGVDPDLEEVFRDRDGFTNQLPIPTAVKSVLARGIAWKAEDRYESIQAFCEALRQAREQAEPVSETGPSGDDGEPVKQPQTEPAASSDARSSAEDAARASGPTDRKRGQSPAWGISDEGFSPSTPTPFHDLFKDGSGDGPELVWLPGGTFRMGSPEGVGRDEERPAHAVALGHYAVGKYPVTVGEFKRFVEATGYRTEAEEGDGAWVWDEGNYQQKSDASWSNPYMEQDDRHPVLCISWNDAKAYCAWLSEQTGQPYGLLTEAQWEYACRADSKTAYCYGDSDSELEKYAWFSGNAGDGTRPVGEKLANAWQLHDMHGNCWEWCEDWFEDYSGDAQQDPSGPESGSYRVFRGGSWRVVADFCRSAFRHRFVPSFRRDFLGFRLSRTGPWRSYPRTLGGAQLESLEETRQPRPADPAQRGSNEPGHTARGPSSEGYGTLKRKALQNLLKDLAEQYAAALTQSANAIDAVAAAKARQQAEAIDKRMQDTQRELDQLGPSSDAQ